MNHLKDIDINILFLDEKKNIFFRFCSMREKKLDGVGPVDNRPYTHKLHHLCPKKIK